MTLGEAIILRSILEYAGTKLSDFELVLNKVLAPRWKIGIFYQVGDRVFYQGLLYKCRQAHDSQENFSPDLAPALWETIDEVHTGSEEDAIPYTAGMALEQDKIYSENGVIYKCTRDTGVPIYNALADLVGIYVETI